MHLIYRLLVIVLVICLVAIALPTVPAEAQDGASIYLSPSSGVPGTEVTIYGYNFTDDEWVDIYYYADTARTWVADIETDDDGDFKVTFVVPESYTGAHKVRAQVDTSTYADAVFTVKPGLTVDPEEGPVGTVVILEGRGFAEEERNIELRYYVNGDYEMIADDIEADEDGWWEASFPIPRSARGNHKIDAGGDNSSFTKVIDATFEVMPEISLDELSGSPGESITMTGSGFAIGERDIKILFAGAAVVTDIRADGTGYWEENFEVPEMPIGTYSVTAYGEWTPERDITALSFEIGSGLVLSLSEGHVGMNLTVAGRGFATNEDVNIMYEDSEVATATTDDKGSFEISFLVPESKYGSRLITARDDEDNEATAVFTMESDPPDTLELISPADGDRVGFVVRIRPQFKWSEVSDDSGVYYSLQISASANVTASGEFADPIVSKEGLVGTNYTLEKAEALRYGTYYWIVRAVDGAENAGNWTAVYSFRAGLLPLWAFIVIIVAIVGAIGAAVYFFVIRKRIYYY